jgi:hypothetical protein
MLSNRVLKSGALSSAIERVRSDTYRVTLTLARESKTIVRSFEHWTTSRPVPHPETLLARAADFTALGSFLDRFLRGHRQFGDTAPFQAFPEVTDEREIHALYEAAHELCVQAHQSAADAWADLGRNGKWEYDWVYDWALMLPHNGVLTDQSLQLYTYEPRYRYVMQFKFNETGGIDKAVFKHAAALERGRGAVTPQPEHYETALARFVEEWRADMARVTGTDELAQRVQVWTSELMRTWGVILTELSSYFLSHSGVFYLQLRDEGIYDGRNRVATRPAGVAVGWARIGDDKRPLTSELWLAPRVVQRDYIELVNQNPESIKGV